jgi:hypothetical protein
VSEGHSVEEAYRSWGEKAIATLRKILGDVEIKQAVILQKEPVEKQKRVQAAEMEASDFKQSVLGQLESLNSLV